MCGRHGAGLDWPENAHRWNLGNTGHFRNCWVLHQNKIRQHGVARFFCSDKANITRGGAGRTPNSIAPNNFQI